MLESELLEELDKLPGRDKENFILDTIKSYPNYYILKNRLANQYINKDEIVKAKAFLEKELSNKYNVHLQITLANLQIKCNTIEAAKKTIAKLKEKNP